MEHGDEPVELEGEEEDSEMDTTDNACPHCGVFFASNSSLANTKKRVPTSLYQHVIYLVPLMIMMKRIKKFRST